jgi:RNA polymerase sigma factor (sigma-70 family)
MESLGFHEAPLGQITTTPLVVAAGIRDNRNLEGWNVRSQERGRLPIFLKNSVTGPTCGVTFFHELGNDREKVMPSGRTNTIASRFAAGAGESVEAMADEQLLECFLSQGMDGAEAAFKVLVSRHGPMVLGVCRHVLNQHQDAEDAFQATFLVLARKAGSIRDRRVLGRWLYEVAYRIAVRARVNAQRRRSHERQGAEMSATVPEFDAAWSELRPVLHDEISRLPEKYRTPVILCYLEGKTNEEVAQQLKWPVGTVKGRLARAREMLRSRLTRRGLALSAAFLVTALSKNTVFAEVVPAQLAKTTIRGALWATARSTPTPPVSYQAISLMEQWLRAERRVRLAITALLLLLIGGALTSAGLFSPRLFGQEPQNGASQFSRLLKQISIAPSSASCH